MDSLIDPVEGSHMFPLWACEHREFESLRFWLFTGFRHLFATMDMIPRWRAGRHGREGLFPFDITLLCSLVSPEKKYPPPWYCRWKKSCWPVSTGWATSRTLKWESHSGHSGGIISFFHTSCYPPGKLTYPTLGKWKSSSKVTFNGIC